MHNKVDKSFKPGMCTKIFGGTGLSAGLIFGMLSHYSRIECFYMSKPQALTLALVYFSIGSAIGISSDYTGELTVPLLP
jgi:hypothetical protein